MIHAEPLAVLQSMSGEQDEAGMLMEQSRQELADLDLNMTGAAMALFDARMRLRAGDHRGAAGWASRSCLFRRRPE